MKVYVLLRDGVPLGFALAAASRCSLWEAKGPIRNTLDYRRLNGPLSLSVVLILGNGCVLMSPLLLGADQQFKKEFNFANFDLMFLQSLQHKFF
ncbi:MAG: hypothetical protein IT342_16795 [Candidatus Melainabacteria bacterium]|nr:hypothetical protein [Candidatus Melainabacteria bacterium]